MEMYVYQKTFHLNKEACCPEITKITNERTVIALALVSVDTGKQDHATWPLHSRVCALVSSLANFVLKDEMINQPLSSESPLVLSLLGAAS